jgi:hypothetical protein
MPRKFYTPKNRYVKNSNLSENEFLLILRCWCSGVEVVSAAKVACVSKVTIHKYYQALGIRALQSFNYRQVAMKRPYLLGVLIASIGHFLKGTWDYEVEREVPPADVNNTMLEVKPQMLYFLRILRPWFRRSYGLNDRLLASYVGYASLIMTAGRESGLNEIANEETANELAEMAHTLFLNELKKEPLDLVACKAFLEMLNSL